MSVTASISVTLSLESKVETRFAAILRDGDLWTGDVNKLCFRQHDKIEGLAVCLRFVEALAYSLLSFILGG